ncbi:MAG: site-2 protease family protein [Fimbriiglobus sp.]|jgi:Zn-dependent protease|nr:site-2 protease family protein [Fimbriiglobus sp.]
MFSNWKIGRPFGIDLYISGWFWLLPILVFATSFASGGADTAFINTTSILAIFGCVALHELGHALAARGYGIRTRDITLYPIGGVARLERMPERPSAEIVIALAGPAVNVVLAVLLGGLWLAGRAVGGDFESASGWLNDFIARLALANVALGVFNMIPAFPMDGGRVLRAFLSWFTHRETATNVAGLVGTVSAILFGVYGLITFNLLLVFLAVSVFMMGRAEVQAVRMQEANKRRRQMWDDERYDWAEPRERREASSRLEPDGWVFHAATGEWVEYRDGWPVRRYRQL